MAGKRNAPKDIISRLADAGEEAIHKVTEIPGAARLTEAMNTTKDRLDELTKRMRGLDAMEKRIAKLERRLDDLQGKRATPAKVAKTTTKAATRSRSPSTRSRSTSTTRKKTS
jgi:hypothetical protein